jgi:ribosomal-protein-alanine N-acetyltransferase
MSFLLRRLELADIDAIERIERASYPTPWSRSMFVSELAKPSSLSIAAVSAEGDLVGYLVLSRYVDAWHVMNVAVDSAHRRRGIASAMLRRLFEVTRDDAERGYTLEVRVSNLGAIGLYESFGFTSRGVRPGYYIDNKEDALIMWKDADQRRPVGANDRAGDDNTVSRGHP